MNKLYHSPGTCSLGVHCLIEEVGAPYELVKIDLMKGQQHSGEYTAVNAKSKVPALLREDGSLLTEWPAIATWLALTHPEKGLLPTDAEGLARTLEHVDYIVATLHMQGFTRIWRPDHFASSEAEQEVVRKKGRDIYEKGLAHFEAKLDGRDYLGGKPPQSRISPCSTSASGKRTGSRSHSRPTSPPITRGCGRVRRWPRRSPTRASPEGCRPRRALRSAATAARATGDVRQRGRSADPFAAARPAASGEWPIFLKASGS